MESLTLTNLLSTIVTACQSVGSAIFGFVSQIVEDPTMLTCVVVIPVALTLASFAFGALRRN